MVRSIKSLLILATTFAVLASACSSDVDELSEPSEPATTGVTSFENYAAWSEHALAPLSPSPDDLGPRWESFNLQLLPESVLFEPAEEQPGTACGLSEPVVLRDGFYAEYGYDDGVDDAVVLVSRGTPDQMTTFFEGIRLLFECPAQREALGTVVVPKPAPDLPDVVEAYRFESDDDIGQRAEGLLVMREDLVYFLEVYTPEDAEPVDIDVLAAQLLATYDGT